MKICDVLKTTARRLKETGIDTADLDARLLLCKYLKKDKLYLIINSQQDIKIDEEFENLVKRREKHEPMQYILERAEFYGLDFKVNENVLIPRPDTEILVEKTIDYIGDNPYTILDIGTGSGCIPIAIAKNCRNSKLYTVDISENATNLAKENARLNNVDKSITFLNMDILKNFPNLTLDCIVSNPPYIEEDVIPTLMDDVRVYEPYIALSGGKDGLVFYRRIIQKACEVLKTGGFIAFEIGYNQATAVAELLDNNFTDIKITKDLAGLDRVVTAIKQ